MRFYYDLDLGQLVQTPGYPNAVNRVDFKRGDAAEIRLGFYQGGRQVSIGSGALLRFALKPSEKYDSDAVVFSDSWTYEDDNTPEYYCNPSFNTVELNALFNHVDGDLDNDLPSVDLMFEITWSVDNEVTWTSTDTISARVFNDVIKGVEGVPTSGSPIYPAASELINLTSNITVTEPINLDNLEGIAGPAGADGADGADSTVPGPIGPAGADGADSTVPGPAGADGADGADNATLESVTTNGATTNNDVNLGRITTDNNTATGANAIAIGGTNNSASNNSCEVLGGDGSTASGQGSTVVGGNNHQNSGNWSATLGGLNHTVTSVRGNILGGANNTLQHNDSCIVGCNGKTSVATSTLHTENLHLFDGFTMPTGATDTYVLTTDATGVGTWQAAGGGGGGTVQGTDSTYQIEAAAADNLVTPNANGTYSVNLQTKTTTATQVASGTESVISGGANNTASGTRSVISGGLGNTASNYWGVVGGGLGNNCTSSQGTISGGYQNTASGIGGSSTVVGGWQCTASGSYGDICGGFQSTSSGYSSVAFGDTGQAQGNFSVVSGGRNNTASGTYSAVLGGASNDTNSQSKAMIVGSNITATDANTLHCNNLKIENGGFKLPTGATNGYVLTTDATGVGTWQAAGGGGGGGTVQNVNLSIEPTDEGTVAGNARGANAVDLQTFRTLATQVASGIQSVIGGGLRNSSVLDYNTVGGGNNNTASGLYGIGGATVSGGESNTASGAWSTVSGGVSNTASAYYSVVGGGKSNNATQFWCTISGGYGNTASSQYSSVLGGVSNTASGPYSAILGGYGNSTNNLADAMIVGSNITADRTDCTFVSNLSIKSIPTSATGLPAGSVWNNGGVLNIV